MSDYMVWIYFLIFVVLILLEMPIGTAMLLSSLLYVIQNGQSFVSRPEDGNIVCELLTFGGSRFRFCGLCNE